MESKDEVIQTHLVVGWDMSTMNPYDAMLLRAYYLSSPEQAIEDANIDRTLWLTVDAAKQLIEILQYGIEKIESSQYDLYNLH